MDNTLVEKGVTKNIKWSIYETSQGKFQVFIGGFHRATKPTLKGARGVIDKIVRANPAEMKTRTSYSRKNPERKTARQMAEEFHGRKVRKEIIIDELYREPSSYAVIGKLEELVVTSLQESSYEYPINFEGQNKNPKKIIEVCCDCDGKQIYFVGGDQNLDSILAELETSDSLTQDLIVLGFCHAITYFTDKHHLEGDNEQKDGVPYEHEFGEQGGTWPVLLYDMVNKKIMLSGGTYEVRDVGIWN